MRHPVPATVSQAVTVTGPLVRRLLITAPRKVELIEERLPPLGPRDVHAQTIVSGISHGTEMAWLKGTAAALRRQWDASQRIYRDGPGRDYPVAPGYESVGRVIQTGPAVATVRPDNLITIDAPHADRYWWPRQPPWRGGSRRAQIPSWLSSLPWPASPSEAFTTPRWLSARP